MAHLSLLIFMLTRYVKRICLLPGLLVLGLAACGASSPLPDMQPGETGRVVRVIDGDALVLNTGQSVRLVGIEAPALGRRDRPPAPYAKEAARALEDMALGREVQLYYPGLTRDRYDRALAHVVTIDQTGPPLWLNMELIKRGAARVRFYPDTLARLPLFLDAEAKARQGSKGLWALEAYRVKPPEQIDKDIRGFTLIETKLVPIDASEQELEDEIACLKRAGESSFFIKIRKAAETLCSASTEETWRLRGWVSDGALELTLPQHAERLKP